MSTSFYYSRGFVKMVHLVIYIWISKNKYECAWNITLSSLILVHETLRYISINFHPFHLYFALHIISYALSTPRISEAFFVHFNLKQINFVRSKTLQTSNRKHMHKKHRTKGKQYYILLKTNDNVFNFYHENSSPTCRISNPMENNFLNHGKPSVTISWFLENWWVPTS